MPCPSNEFPSSANIRVTDLLELHPFTAGVQFEPRNKAELVAAVAAATSGPRSLRAVGSVWSLSGAHTADDVVDTTGLDLHISPPWPAGGAALEPGRLRAGGSGFLQTVCSRDGRADGHHFVHVEAGIKVKQLLADLKSCGLALPTMGAGGGQSLAGALSTGTHGADFTVPPLVEWIRAVHLVGPGGQEWWITPATSIFVDELLSALPDWCDDTRIVPDDDAFNAVRVAVGRMGVIYSMILEVVPAYGLVEVNLMHNWREIRDELARSHVAAGTVTGMFDTTLSDLETGWFRSEVLSRTIVFLDNDGEFRYINGPSHHVEPPESLVKERQFHRMLGVLGLSDIAADLRGGPPRKLHHLNIAVNLSSPGQCWSTRRWRAPADVRSVKLALAEREPVEIAVLDNKRNPPAIVRAVQEALVPEAWYERVGLDVAVVFNHTTATRLDWFTTVEVPRIADEGKARGETSFETLFMILYKLATDPVLASDIGPVVLATVAKSVGGRFSNLVRAGSSGDVLDVHDYDLDHAASGNSTEYFFDASLDGYLGFMDTVLDLARAHAPVFGYMGIRFTPHATPLIAMQRFPLTVAVEVATARARREDVYRAFWADLHRAANEHGGIAHWGQESARTATQVAAGFGEDMVTWRRMLAELSIEGRTTFSTPFSRATGLEPSDATGLFEDDATELFLAALAGASDDGPDDF